MLSNNIISIIEKNINLITNLHDLNLLKNQYLGKNGYISKQFKKLKNHNLEDKIKKSIILHKYKKIITKIFIEYKKKLENIDINQKLTKQSIDITLPGRINRLGSIHPINNIINKIKYFFIKLGFQHICGPEIENNYYNFDALNIESYHSIRTQKDTFWINNDILLRTQTSNIQIRIMNMIPPPIRILTFGKVYRHDYDNTHTPMFHQMEGLYINNNVNFTDLKNILLNFVQYFFNKKIKVRFRPSYFPFTEPSLEVDIMNNKNKWIEILGAGLVHPNVLKNVNIDANTYTGYAFGIGIERLTMLYYNLQDIRVLFENDIRFLQQFNYITYKYDKV
ncbi:phenylalanine--tRNA ligase subunit alpha [Enterobacteriaceae endosymbiont of Neohaemonia nigricornis]|uniref:phenylalanine--tRNA ligase subunit alpha n=1 Tax=Enterobacteriaceae endosymbiont of Neohaemonia nigricornis TaxID=2675792 RepID=UPI001449BA1A|nr:phenylalanine--tRNA ligase subunit alpha [Enterobacteriaceae endosymbiont of Neohaemonia nigricornis]QJC30309.1 phenylalanine--tRNA ligase subunit alpha [Enterobacteriaceae endosymbiont of Neohaemonia nigricornis]